MSQMSLILMPYELGLDYCILRTTSGRIYMFGGLIALIGVCRWSRRKREFRWRQRRWPTSTSGLVSATRSPSTTSVTSTVTRRCWGSSRTSALSWGNLLRERMWRSGTWMSARPTYGRRRVESGRTPTNRLRSTSKPREEKEELY